MYGNCEQGNAKSIKRAFNRYHLSNYIDVENNRRLHTLLSGKPDRLLTHCYTVYGIQFWVFHTL